MQILRRYVKGFASPIPVARARYGLDESNGQNSSDQNPVKTLLGLRFK